MSDTFLSPDELVELTDRKNKATQIAQLRAMGIAFFVNASGRAVVTRSAIESRNIVDHQPKKAGWKPKVISAQG